MNWRNIFILLAKERWQIRKKEKLKNMTKEKIKYFKNEENELF